MKTKRTKLTMTVEEAAAALGIGRNVAYAAAHRGIIPCIRIGKRILVSRIALDRLLENPPPYKPGPGLTTPSRKVLEERFAKKRSEGER